MSSSAAKLALPCRPTVARHLAAPLSLGPNYLTTGVRHLTVILFFLATCAGQWSAKFAANGLSLLSPPEK
ncbi:hypothetical protein M5D96_005113 [Drosophila gunungcola]|uniref:Uncharacterized protein n=1 Tax=Drosophila gunungcola TaxID=103775 RepID=A0A9Q0BTX1_9MUSC|nr:hypothetical protein M5D96_005113 [Drosophila gunungcola]